MRPTWQAGTFLLWFHAHHTLAVSLSQFQAIAGFPPLCTSTWNSEIPGCAAEDFDQGRRPCSAACIEGLQSTATTLNQTCAGSEVGEDTLIGLFFRGLGVSTVCPGNAVASPKALAGTQTEGRLSRMPTPPSPSPPPPPPPTTIITTTTSSSFPSEPTESSLTPSTSMASTLYEYRPPATTQAVSPTDTCLSDSTVTSTTMHATNTGKPSTSILQPMSDLTATSTTHSAPGSDETQGFGGSGNAFDILAGGGATRDGGKGRGWVGAGMAVAAIWVAGMF
ncbi:hypothetical protein ASPZODRAFT_128345 [Penicilliopsis zonata CBS 506.65]|uniref:Extracellular membrane protein CFEM domain-containing protein n=1 Tax=Penicilliopsis zonata CBS 506.65 TaxID=1073090 RepID=A0A1L9SRR4_9EURO|nr:hypothetical protein ASPZODRAFT_128345 [Penicilliopsis zonata CBS 506.65]OJJ49814.1 hypothetical protein ASPZODRAFT_128345 [Penicilliopsis zonata CBS 506.65]